MTEQCKQMEPMVRPLFTICEKNNKLVVAAEVPGVDVIYRPVFYKGVGRVKGSYIRVGESDETMNEYEVYGYDAFRKRIRDDLRVVDNAKIKLFNKERLQMYISNVRSERKKLSDNVSEEEILELMGITSNDVPTLSGVMVFSKYPQAYFLQLYITAVVVPRTQVGELGIDNERITGSISEMLDQAVDFVRRNSRTKTIIDNSGVRQDKNEYPIIAVREAILNALVHRDYSVHSENVPIRIEMYRNRMEIINSGGLYGRITIDSLGKILPDTRNPALANILDLLNVTENRYSGIPTIRKAFKEATLPAPIFESKHGEFKVVFKNNIYLNEGAKTGNMERDILEFCSIPRTRSELCEFTGKSRYYTMSNIIYPLIEQGKLNMTMPHKPKSSKQKYIRNKSAK